MGSLIDDIKKYFNDAKIEILCIAAGLAATGIATYYLVSELYKRIRKHVSK